MVFFGPQSQITSHKGNLPRVFDKILIFCFKYNLGHLMRNTVDSLSRTPSISNFSLSRTIFSVPFLWFQPNFLSLSRTLSISNKFLGPLRVRDRESTLYGQKVFSANVPKVLIFGLLVQTGTINDFFILGLGIRFILALLLVSSQSPYDIRSFLFVYFFGRF